MASAITFEICVDSVESARAAEAGGAARIELCMDLLAGGLTPSAGLIAMVRREVTIPLHVLIRPRGGDFVYSADEFDIMQRDIILARQLGANGVVLGVLDANHNVDVPRTGELVQAAEALSVTFHRAFDRTPNALWALDGVRQAGVKRILTAGGSSSAEEGIPVLAELVKESNGEVVIMAGGGIREGNVGRIVTETGVTEVHTSLQAPIAPAENEKPFGLADVRAQVLTVAEVARFVLAATPEEIKKA